MAKTKQNRLEFVAGILTLVFSVIGLVLFLMSFTTGYYTFGGMNSGIITVLLAPAIVIELAVLLLAKKLDGKLWAKFITFIVTGLLAAAAILLIGDRVEGIGNCIVTDYDSGHGGEEAIYYSIGASISMLIAVVYNIIGSFSNPHKADGKVKKIVLSATAVVAAFAVVLSTLNLTGVLSGPAGTGGSTSGTYTISYSQAAGNADEGVMPTYQFLCSDLSGMVRADSRFYVDISLTLNSDNTYSLFTDAYVIESGKRAELGDDTGLGMVLTTTAEGTYVINADGTVTTSVPTHAVFEMETDTYSSQMKGAAQMNVNGNDEDGVYDSADEPAVLDFVPETTWTLGEEGDIITYGKAGAQSNAYATSYTISFAQANGNADEGVMPTYQFLCSDFSGMVRADSRFYVDITLTLNDDSTYALFADAYVIESGKRAELGDDTGLGMVLTTTAEGTYTWNEDGTVTTSVPTHAVFEMETDTYSSQMKGAVQMNVNGNDEDGVYDSTDEPAVLDFVPETIWTLGDGTIETYCRAGETAGTEAEELITVTSEDGATTFTFYADGTYRFFFEAYSVEDRGTYTYDGTTLTITNPNGDVVTAEGDPLTFHYVTSVSDQVTGDFSVAAADLAGAIAAAGEELTTVTSEDGATTFTFYTDGTYRFFFEAYSVEDKGTYTYDGTTLTITNPNGDVVTAQGDPLTFHYVTSVSDQVTGDFSVAAADLAGAGAAGAEELTTVTSEDGATTFTFYADGTYRFFFEAYSVEDKGTYTYDGTTLTITNPNGDVVTAQGDTLTFHYVTSVSDQVTGDFSVAAADLAGGAAAGELTSVTSEDGATTFTFYTDGTYRFFFEAYSVEDKGTYTYDGTTLTITNPNGDAVTAEGDPLAFHYVTSVSDQVTGDFSVAAADLAR